MSEKAELPYWLIEAQIVVTMFVAAVTLIATIWIQINQGRVAKNKLKLDLFDKRYELLKIITAMTKLSNRNTEDFLFEMSKECDKFREYGLLFPKIIADKVDQLVEHCYEYQGLLQETKDMRNSSEAAEANRKFRAAQNDMERRFLDLQKQISEFIRVEWEG